MSTQATHTLSLWLLKHHHTTKTNRQKHFTKLKKELFNHRIVAESQKWEKVVNHGKKWGGILNHVRNVGKSG